jgi:hypothetical protein
MAAPSPHSHSEPSTARKVLHPIHTHISSDDTALDFSTSSPPFVYDSTVLPPSHDARTLVLCFDGTGDQFDTDVRTPFLSSSRASDTLAHRMTLLSSLQNSNIVQLFSMLKKDDKSQQLVYYQVRGDGFALMRCGGSDSRS